MHAELLPGFVWRTTTVDDFEVSDGQKFPTECTERYKQYSNLFGLKCLDNVIVSTDSVYYSSLGVGKRDRKTVTVAAAKPKNY